MDPFADIVGGPKPKTSTPAGNPFAAPPRPAAEHAADFGFAPPPLPLPEGFEGLSVFDAPKPPLSELTNPSPGGKNCLISTSMYSLLFDKVCD
jgi:hypothetical protein